MEKRALLLFTRLPLPGTVKTRLMPRLGGKGCAELQWALLADLLPRLREAGGELFVFITPSGHREAAARLRELAGGAACLTQQGDGLGERMYAAFGQAFGWGCRRCLLIGSDIPFIGREDIAAAWRLLDDHDAVFGPSEDGGYWLAGLKKPCAPLFARRIYGHGTVLAQALAVCAAHGLSAGTASAKRDLDTWDDLLHFRRLTTPQNAPNLYGFLHRVLPAP